MNRTTIRLHRGDGPYVFICYAHADAADVYPLLELLDGEQIALWYDQGIAIGSEWSESLAQAIENCIHVLFLASPSAIASEHCRREISFAQSEKKPIVTVHLEPVEMPSGLRLALNNRQAILKYELAANVFASRLVTALSAREPADSESSGLADQKKQSRVLLVAVLVLLIGILGYAGRLMLTNQTEPEPTLIVAANEIENSIAILPFQNLSPAAEDSYFAVAMHDSLLHELARIDSLNVIARSTMQTYAYNGKNVDSRKPIAEIARALRVTNVMEGSVQLAQGRVILRVSLIDPKTGTTLWANRYDKPVEDLFSIQIDIATEIASALQVEILDEEVASIKKPYSSSPEAMVFFLKARAITDNLAPNMPAEMYTFLDAAIAADPNMAIAHGMKSFALALSLGLMEVKGMDLVAHKNSVLRHASLAITSPDGTGYGYAAKAMVAEQSGDWTQAEKWWRRATAAAPNDFDVLDDYARFMAFIGDEETLEALVKHGQNLNPADHQLLQGVNIILGKFDGISVDLATMSPMSQAMVNSMRGNTEMAVTILSQIAGFIPHRPIGVGTMCYLLALNERIEESATWCKRAEAMGPESAPLPAVHHGHWLAALGRRDVKAVVRALEVIEQSELMGPFYFQHINNIFKDSLMDEPEVLAVRKRMGFRGKDG